MAAGQAFWAAWYRRLAGDAFGLIFRGHQALIAGDALVVTLTREAVLYVARSRDAAVVFKGVPAT